MSGRVAWVTTAPARGHDEDEALALPALAALGLALDVLDWDDPDADWAAYDRVLLRSAWDYPARLGEFLRWVDAVPHLLNAPAVVRWSADKRYLADLAAAGVPVVPTAYAAPGSAVALPVGEVVVKPAVAGGGRDAAWYAAGEHAAARAHVARLHEQGRTALVQPRLASVARDGERAVVLFDGVVSHAATKRVPLPRGRPSTQYVASVQVPAEATGREREVAAAAVDVARSRWGTPTYARVDLVADDAGQPCVLELELVEPSLLLAQAGAGAAGRLAAAVLRAVRER